MPSPDGTVYQYVIRRPGLQPETKTYSPTAVAEDDFFDGFRRVQVISQPLSFFQLSHYPQQQLEAFRNFVELFEDASSDSLPFKIEMRQMYTRIKKHLLQHRNVPPFSSFSQIKKWQKKLAEESTCLFEEVDQLFETLCDDPARILLTDYIFSSRSIIHSHSPIIMRLDQIRHDRANKSYYGTLLIQSLQRLKRYTPAKRELNMAGKPKVLVSGYSPRGSKDQMQWMLLDSRIGRHF